MASTTIYIIGIALGIIDLLFMGGAVVLPIVGIMTKGVQELFNEGLQMVILTYFYMLTKRKK